MTTETAAPFTTSRTVKGFRGNRFERVTAFCPNGHELVDAPHATPTGKRLLAGDFRGEWCTPCKWDGGER